MKETLYDIARAIVDNPEEVTILDTEDGKDVKLVLSVAEGDMGKVIGRNGKNAKAIRTVMKAVAASDGKRVTVDIR
ncbi:MAG: KH domain-containing protein [Clostridia bacterium]|nr:KH domain-containing protein [Clostridia bacterium]